MNWKPIRAALAASGLSCQNWSADGETVLALYGSDGSYIGVVRVEGTRATMTGPKWYAKHVEAFNRFSSALAATETSAAHLSQQEKA